MSKLSDISEYIRIIPDFPRLGILFQDITPIFLNPYAFGRLLDDMSCTAETLRIDKIAAIEARGFPIAAALAYRLSKGLILVRKKGKLPGPVLSQSYDLEYGTEVLEMHNDCLSPDEHIVIVDDVVATGETIKASANMIRELGGIIEHALCISEVAGLGGCKKLQTFGITCHMVIPENSETSPAA
jgi:adenine phosphoribosyltransferase